MKRYRLAKLAESDFEDIWVYVAGDRGVEVADRMVGEIVDRFALLATHPQAGRLRDDIAAELRSFPVEGHIIYYRPERARILVARVLHRQPRSSLGVWASGRRVGLAFKTIPASFPSD